MTVNIFMFAFQAIKRIAPQPRLNIREDRA